MARVEQTGAEHRGSAGHVWLIVKRSSNNQAAMEAFDAAAQSLLDLARAEYGLGRIDSAARILARAADAARDLGQQDLRLARALNRLGVIRSRQGNHSEAEHLLKEALAIVERANLRVWRWSRFLRISAVSTGPCPNLRKRAQRLSAPSKLPEQPGRAGLAVAWALDQVGDLEAMRGQHFSRGVLAPPRPRHSRNTMSGSNDWSIAAAPSTNSRRCTSSRTGITMRNRFLSA